MKGMVREYTTDTSRNIDQIIYFDAYEEQQREARKQRQLS